MSYHDTTAKEHLIDLRNHLEFLLRVINDNPQDLEKAVTFADLRLYLEDIIEDLP